MQRLNLLVGDNPFHGISHLSQEHARIRPYEQTLGSSDYAANLVQLSLENGANGFMFSVDEITLSIIRNLSVNFDGEVQLYAIAPYAYEYVRKSTQTGGVSGLAASLAKEMIFSKNIKVIAENLGGLARFDLSALLKAYVAYELSRIKSAMNGSKNIHLEAFMLHEIVTDMALALDMKDLCKGYISFLKKNHVRAGFETRNFPFLVDKFSEWGFDFNELTITAAFNKVGFQMCPSQWECEVALENAKGAEVIAMSVLAAGYLKPAEAYSYVASLEGLSGLVIGVSKEYQATETFKLFSESHYEAPIYA
ncbi:MAG TPA: hypothetical protein VLH35_05345 [Candidatus Acidoferrales bacterium]|nr:hypothetical protein [Candidatus Acidoferrales bacterium]